MGHLLSPMTRSGPSTNRRSFGRPRFWSTVVPVAVTVLPVSSGAATQPLLDLAAGQVSPRR